MENLLVMNDSQAAAPAVLPPAAKLLELFELFVEMTNTKPTTAKAYRAGIKRFTRWLASCQIAQPDALSFARYVRALEEAGLKANTRALYINSVKALYSWMAKRFNVANITVDVHAPVIPKGHKRAAFETEEVSQVLNVIDESTPRGKRDKVLLSTLFVLGLRTIEIERATVGDYVLVGYQRRLYVQGKGKEEAADFVPVPEALALMIDEYLASRPGITAASPLFESLSTATPPDTPLKAGSVSEIAKAYFRKAGFDDPMHTAHSTRHTAITEAFKAGLPYREIQAFARHEKFETTLIYAHDLEKKNNRCSSAIADRLLVR